MSEKAPRLEAGSLPEKKEVDLSELSKLTDEQLAELSYGTLQDVYDQAELSEPGQGLSDHEIGQTIGAKLKKFGLDALAEKVFNGNEDPYDTMDKVFSLNDEREQAKAEVPSENESGNKLGLSDQAPVEPTTNEKDLSESSETKPDKALAFASKVIDRGPAAVAAMFKAAVSPLPKSESEANLASKKPDKKYDTPEQSENPDQPKTIDDLSDEQLKAIVDAYDQASEGKSDISHRAAGRQAADEVARSLGFTSKFGDVAAIEMVVSGARYKLYPPEDKLENGPSTSPNETYGDNSNGGNSELSSETNSPEEESSNETSDDSQDKDADDKPDASNGSSVVATGEGGDAKPEDKTDDEGDKQDDQPAPAPGKSNGSTAVSSEPKGFFAKTKDKASDIAASSAAWLSTKMFVLGEKAPLAGEKKTDETDEDYEKRMRRRGTLKTLGAAGLLLGAGWLFKGGAEHLVDYSQEEFGWFGGDGSENNPEGGDPTGENPNTGSGGEESPSGEEEPTYSDSGTKGPVSQEEIGYSPSGEFGGGTAEQIYNVEYSEGLSDLTRELGVSADDRVKLIEAALPELIEKGFVYYDTELPGSIKYGITEPGQVDEEILDIFRNAANANGIPMNWGSKL